MTEQPIFKRMQALEKENQALKNEIVELKNELFIKGHREKSTDRIVSRNNAADIANWTFKKLPWRNQTKTLRGEPGGAKTRGRLESDYRWNQAQNAIYVIYSWDTPIVWFDQEGFRTSPNDKHSHTTTTQIKLVNDALDRHLGITR